MHSVKQKKIIAHRGIPVFSHENTIESFERAIDFNADMIEFDIRRTADGVLIIFHDPFITNNGSNILLRDLSFSELQSIANQNGFKIPSVKDLFETFADRTGFDIEFKEEGCEEETLYYVQKHDCADNCIITSFNEAVIRKVQEKCPKIQAGLLIENSEKLCGKNLSSLSIVCPHKELFLKNRSFFTEWKTAEKHIAVWTVDEQSQLELFFDDPLIDYIITNRCDKALELQKNRLQL
jgi:glycerophosphoryl diester phosphodiesterase